MFNYIKKDISNFLLQNIPRLLLVIIFTIICSVKFSIDIDAFSSTGYVHSEPSFFDYICYFTEGIRPYSLNSNEPFIVPFAWLGFVLLNVFLVGDIVYKDISGFGMHVILNNGSVNRWLLGKTCCCFFGIFVSYIIEYLTCFVFSFFKNGGVFPQTDIWEMYFGINRDVFDSRVFFITLLVVPFLSTVAICMAQLFLSVVIKPIFAFVTTGVYICASAFYSSYFLIGNHSMFLRSCLVIENGFNPIFCIGIDLFIVVLMYFLLKIVVSKYDIL